jgi:hypothetical protein
VRVRGLRWKRKKRIDHGHGHGGSGMKTCNEEEERNAVEEREARRRKDEEDDDEDGVWTERLERRWSDAARMDTDGHQ